MSYRDLPEHLLSSISPDALRHYALASGWSFSKSLPERFDVFAHPGRDLEQVLIPVGSAAPDYARRVGDALLVLSEVERRPVQQVLTDLLRTGNVGYFRIPGEATRRDYAVYIMVAAHRRTGERRLYVGKTGDNREGCNPVISRAGNHFSFNWKHAQMRARVDDPENYDFDYFYTTFGPYAPLPQGRESVDLINEMERQLNVLAQKAFGAVVVNPYRGRRRLRPEERARRLAFATPERVAQLQRLVAAVQSSIRLALG